MTAHRPTIYAEHPCPDCGCRVVRVDYASDPSDYRCWDDWDCRWQSETPPGDPDAEVSR